MERPFGNRLGLALPLWGGDGTPGRVDPFHCKRPFGNRLGLALPLWGGDGTSRRVELC